MKYARTTGGMLNYIINLEKWCKEDFGYILWMDRGYRTIRNYNIVNQADTIEELCDMLVLVSDFTKGIYCMTELKEIRSNYVSNLQWNEEYKKYNVKIYGAIWTDKGLIYVAKMNEKGELELI